MRVGELPQFSLVEVADRLGDECSTGKLDLVDARRALALLAAGALYLEAAHVLGQLPVLALQVFDRRARAIGGRAERLQQLLERRADGLVVLNGAGAGDRLDAAHTRSDAAFRDDGA